MSKYCRNCGKPLDEGAKFCTLCGARASQPEQPVTQQRRYTPQPQVRVPEQFAQRNAVKAEQSVRTEKKKKGKGVIVAVIAIVLVAAIVLGVFGFRDGGWFRGKGRDTNAESGSEIQCEHRGNKDPGRTRRR